MSECSQSAQKTLLNETTPFSSSFSAVLLPHLGGNAHGAPDEPSAISYRDAEYLANIQASWEDASEDTTQISWAKRNFDVLAPFATGQYVNFMIEDEVSNASVAAYDPKTMKRLRQIKRKYDPGNVINMNNNILPPGE